MQRISLALSSSLLASLLAASPQRATANTTFVVSMSSLGMQVTAGVASLVDSKSTPPFGFAPSYVERIEASVATDLPGLGPVSVTEAAEQSTKVTQDAESILIESSGSTDGRKTALALPTADLIQGGDGTNGVAVSVSFTQRIAYTVEATVTTRGAMAGTAWFGVHLGQDEVTVKSFDSADASGRRRSRPTGSFSRSGILDPAVAPEQGSVGVLASIEGGAGLAGGRLTWNIRIRLGPTAADGDEVHWINRRGGAYGAQDNWNPKQVPTDDDSNENDTAIFDLPGAYAVDLGDVVAVPPQRRVERLFVRAGKPTFLSADLVANSASRSEPSVEVSRRARLTISGGRLESQHALVGGGTGSPPAAAGVTVTGQDALWENAQTMRLGSSGTSASLDVGGRGLVRSAFTYVDGSGRAVAPVSRVSVQGVGSSWAPGDLSAGGGSGLVILDVGGGAAVTTGSSSLGGGARVAVVVHGEALGAPSSWTVPAPDHELDVGDGGVASFTVEDGATAAIDRVVLGAGRGSSGKLVVRGRSASQRRSDLNANSVVVGFERRGFGQLEVLDGGSVDDGGNLEVGLDGGEGVVHVRGSTAAPAALGVLGALTLGTGGPFGVGVLRVEGDAASVTCASAKVGATSEGTGLVSIEAGGLLEVAGGMDVAVGSVSLSDATLRVGGSLTIAPTATLSGTGRVVVAGALIADGGIRPGRSPGTLTIEGNLVVGPTAVIDVEVAGAGALSDDLVVTGDLTLNGLLVVHFINGYAPRAGDEFEVIHAGGATIGDFANVQVEGLAPGADIQMTTVGGAHVVRAVNDAVALPTVSAKGPKKLSERSKRPGFVVISRGGATTSPLTVTYSLEGTAANGGDYALLSGTTTIPAGKKSAKVLIAPANDFDVEGDETVLLVVTPGAGYSRSLASAARIVIVDDD